MDRERKIRKASTSDVSTDRERKIRKASIGDVSTDWERKIRRASAGDVSTDRERKIRRASAGDVSMDRESKIRKASTGDVSMDREHKIRKASVGDVSTDLECKIRKAIAGDVSTDRERKIGEASASDVSMDRERKIKKASTDDEVKKSLNLGCVRFEAGSNAASGQVNAQEQTSLAKNVLGDTQCERVRELLIKALSKVTDEAGEEIRDRVINSDVVRVAVAVESAIIKTIDPSKRQKCAKARSILFNLQDPKNPDLRKKVLLGDVQPDRLAKMTSQEMASDRMQEEYKKIIEATMESSTRHRGHGGRAEATTDQFCCGRCGQRECVYHQMQTRSADEPMTTYVTCIRCQNRWKFS